MAFGFLHALHFDRNFRPGLEAEIVALSGDPEIDQLGFGEPQNVAVAFAEEFFGLASGEEAVGHIGDAGFGFGNDVEHGLSGGFVSGKDAADQFDESGFADAFEFGA